MIFGKVGLFFLWLWLWWWYRTEINMECWVKV